MSQRNPGRAAGGVGGDGARGGGSTAFRRRLLVGLACLAAVVGASAYVLDAFAGRALEHFASEAVGAEVRVGSADVSPFRPHLVLHDLVVENPAGFEDGPALSVARLSLSVDLGSLTGPVMRLREIAAEGFDLRYSRSGDTANLDAIEANAVAFLERRGFASAPRLSIEELSARGGRATAPIVVGHATVPLEDLSFRDIGGREEGLPPPDLVAELFDLMEPSLGNALAHTDYGGLLRKGRRGVENAARKLKKLFD